MLIDWFTVVAQVVNFLVLVALMKHFLYGRLVQAIDDREKKIETRIAEAEEKNRAADKRTDELRIQAANSERERDQIIADAKKDADRQRHEMIAQARDSAKAMETRWHEDLDREKTAFLGEIRKRSAAEILAVTRRALADLACSDVQESAVHAFVAKLDSMNGSAAKQLGGGEITILSAAEIPEPLRAQIRRSLEKRLGELVTLRFVQTPQMAWGLELRANGQKLGWNSETYTDLLEENLKTALEETRKTW